MGNNQIINKTVLVTGDVIVDYHIYMGNRYTPDSKSPEGTQIVESYGGARLLYDIIDTVCSSANKKISEIRAKKDQEKPDLLVDYSVRFGLRSTAADDFPEHLRSYAVWSPCKKEKKSEIKVWRMTQPMGYGNREAKDYKSQHLIPDNEDATPNIIVLDDAGLGFRSNTNRHAWPTAIHEGEHDTLDWVVLKMSSPVAYGDLWREICNKFQERLVVITSISDLRCEEVGVARRLSWERTAQDLLTELWFNARIRDLTKCKHLIVSFGSEGAIWIQKNNNQYEYHLVFDPENLEGEWGEKIDGRAFGYSSCLVASIVSQLTLQEKDRNITTGIMSGLSAMRQLHREGHGETRNANPAFPFQKIADSILNPSSDYRVAQIPPPPKKISGSVQHWTIIEGYGGRSSINPVPLYGLARRVALFGFKALSNIPYARFNNLLTVDRQEIESLRGLQRLLKDFDENKRPSRPLSIAVFGPPGSGKSFSIKQIAKSVLGKDIPFLEFNLSQFDDPDDLIGLFHQVRDKVLEGGIPLIFWDEFDSKGHMWLQYLLAPMQDGKFQEGQISHSIGKCGFVFAGGTSYTMENFAPSDKNSKEYHEFKLLKGPDFISRLSGYLNVIGPNRRQIYDKGQGKWIDDDRDICFPIRRALLIRVVLGLEKDEIMNIDKGLLTAFLEIDQYEHGARSLETILSLSKRSVSGGLMRSDLPPEDQMSLHADYNKFMSLLQRDLPFKMNSELLAPAVHEYFRQDCKKQWLPFQYDMDYSELPDDIKASNIEAASRIPEVLSLAGLILVPKDHHATLAEADLKKILEDNIENFAEAEHDGWIEQKFREGWVCGSPRDNDKKIHPTLIPYKDLREEDKEKDRNQVRRYPDIVRMAGYKIIQNK